MMTKNHLLLITRVQEIDLFFTEKGFSRKYIHSKIIYPSFFISERTYFKQLSVNSKKILREKYNLDWEKELNKHRNLDYIRIMEQLKSVDLLEVPEYLLMLHEGARK
jgi:hypothetical protein